MAAELAVTLVGDEAKLWKAQQRILAQQMKLSEGYDKMGRKAQEASKKGSTTARTQTSALSQLKTQLAQVVGGYGGVQGAIQAVTRAWQNQERIARASADAALAAANAQASVIKNIGDVSAKTTSAFIADVEKTAYRAGMPSANPALEAAASILSATGGDRAKTLGILGTAAPFFRDKPEDLPAFGGSLADVMKISQGTPEKAAALMLSIFGQARFTELGAFKNVTSALAAGEVVAPGDRMRALRESGALVAGVGGRIADPEAAKTGTAVANLMANLRTAAPELDSTFKRLAKVQTDPGLQEEVLKKGFKGAIKPVIEDLVRSPESQTSREVMAAFKALAAPEEMVARKQAQLSALTPQMRAATFQRGAAGRMEQYLAGGEGMVTRGTVSKEFYSALWNSQRGMFDFLRLVGSALKFEAMRGLPGVDTPQAAEMAIRGRINQVREAAVVGDIPAGLMPTGALAGPLLAAKAAGALSPSDRARIQLLQSLLAEIRGLRQDARSAARGDTMHRPAAIAERAAQRE